jgi:hypothetical protein
MLQETLTAFVLIHTNNFVLLVLAVPTCMSCVTQIHSHCFNGHHMGFRYGINAYIYDKLNNEFVIGQVLTTVEEIK